LSFLVLGQGGRQLLNTLNSILTSKILDERFPRTALSDQDASAGFPSREGVVRLRDPSDT